MFGFNLEGISGQEGVGVDEATLIIYKLQIDHDVLGLPVRYLWSSLRFLAACKRRGCELEDIIMVSWLEHYPF